ncbi:class II fructose-bisphosphate aldolase [Chakrabartyella piscis]|uniref:class II fructose-bisphosphate aldolase n=1 Tax=Chakrabartyella piscis TaxID=2918914 RepID=UPI00295888C7|nr:class II fructose-bisphosphate aldolase [Chakrabartyella piscis]
MSLVTIADMLNKARKEKYCVGAFDASTLEMATTIIEAAEEVNAPVIIMGLLWDMEGDMAEYWVHCVCKMAERATVPVCVHLDHATDMERLKLCVDLGMTSVMYDGSILPLEENIALTKEAADYAHARGVTVEAELGHVGNGLVSGEAKSEEEFENPDDTLTKAEELKYFVEQTNVDCLAVAVGTTHGVYTSTPKLHFDLIEELNAISPVPLVLHGGSGTPDDQIKLAIEKGVCKINIHSDLMNVYFREIEKKIQSSATYALWIKNANEKPLAAVKEIVKEKIELLGSVNKA